MSDPHTDTPTQPTSPETAPTIIEVGGFSLNLDMKWLIFDGVRIHLTGKEYAIVELLYLRKGTTLTKDMLLSHLYGGIDEPELKIIDVFICKIRKKMTLISGGKHVIGTVWGRGYVLRVPDEA